jgi:hypothetical protein
LVSGAKEIQETPIIWLPKADRLRQVSGTHWIAGVLLFDGPRNFYRILKGVFHKKSAIWK